MTERKDFLTVEERSLLMSKIRGKDTKPELMMARLLRAEKIRYRRHVRLPGTPDFRILTPARGLTRIVVFVDGEFWHGKDWNKLKKKLEHKPYWVEKITKNRARDRRVDKELADRGYIGLRFWESAVKKEPDAVIETIREALLWDTAYTTRRAR
jgi:DNA mismatch endonuclease (patch repair protein)